MWRAEGLLFFREEHIQSVCLQHIYAFRANHLILEKQLLYSTLWKTIKSTQHSLVTSNSLCVVEVLWVLPHALVLCIGFIFIWLMFRQSCWCDFTGTASGTIKRNSLTANSLRILIFPQLLQYSMSLRYGSSGQTYQLDPGSKLYICIGCGLLQLSLSVAKKIFLEEKLRLYLSVGKRTKKLECC